MLPIFNMLFQLVLTKFFKSELFLCLPKVDLVIKSCKEPTVWNEIQFAGVYFCGLAIFCVLRELIFAIRSD